MEREEQRQSLTLSEGSAGVESACGHKVAIITGGPGTGKTTITGSWSGRSNPGPDQRRAGRSAEDPGRSFLLQGITFTVYSASSTEQIIPMTFSRIIPAAPSGPRSKPAWCNASRR